MSAAEGERSFDVGLELDEESGFVCGGHDFQGWHETVWHYLPDQQPGKY